MRYLLLALAACSSGWQQKTAATSVEPDSRTDYADDDSFEPDGPPLAPARRTCAPQPHTTQAGITVAFANLTSYAADICTWTDQALDRLPSVTGISGFELGVTLHSLRVKGVHITCHVSVGVRSPMALVGVFQQAVSVQSSSSKHDDIEATKRDCVDANIDDLVRQRAVPAIKRHALAAPSPSPAP